MIGATMDSDYIYDELAELTAEHRALDKEIHEMSSGYHSNMIHVMQLKRKKLVLKEKIEALRSMLHPDIIA